MDEEALTTTWIAIARGLAVISILSLAAGFVVVLGASGISARDRVFIACQSADALTGAFALAAVAIVLLARVPPERSRGLVGMAFGIGVVTIVCATYAALYALTRHTDHLQPEVGNSFFALIGLNWSYRLTGLLNAIEAAVMGVLIVLAARRAVRRTGHAPLLDLGGTPGEHP